MSSPAPHRPAASRQYGWRIGSIVGVPVYIGRSWPVIAVVVMLLFAPQVRTVRPEMGTTYAYVVAALYALLLLVSVLAHEAAHAVTGVKRGYQVSRVVVHLLGGHTIYESKGNRPGSSALVAVSGPAANLALAGLSYGLQQVVPWATAWMLLGASTFANLFVAVFNLLPGLPLDGGHLVESAVWGATGNRNKGLIVAGWCGRAVTGFVLGWFLVVPIVQGHSLDVATIAWVALVVAFLWSGAGRAIATGHARERLASVPLRSVLRPMAVARHTASVADVAVPLESGTVVVLDGDGQPMGIVNGEAVSAIPVERRQVTTVETVTQRLPDPWVIPADVEGDILPVVEAIQSGGADVVVVVGADGQPAGCVHADDVEAILAT